MIEIIAEIGVNHNGNYRTAVELIDAAKDAGADTVKFQLWRTERSYARDRWAEMGRLELFAAELQNLKEHCDNIGIRFLCTPDAFQDALILKQMGVDRIKIGSSNVTNLPMLHAVRDLNLPTILSTGACSSREMMEAIRALQPRAIMHCISAYPAPFEEMNLRVIDHMRSIYDCRIGFSDHSVGAMCAWMALAMGATIFEKHLTMNCAQRGPDHAMSAEPGAFRAYVQCLRNAEIALGNGDKRVMPCEIENRRSYDEFVQRQP